MKKYIKILMITCFIALTMGVTKAAVAEKTVTMPIAVNLLQCGSRKEIKKACERNKKCCLFLSPSEKPNDFEEVSFNKNMVKKG